MTTDFYVWGKTSRIFYPGLQYHASPFASDCENLRDDGFINHWKYLQFDFQVGFAAQCPKRIEPRDDSYTLWTPGRRTDYVRIVPKLDEHAQTIGFPHEIEVLAYTDVDAGWESVGRYVVKEFPHGPDSVDLVPGPGEDLVIVFQPSFIPSGNIKLKFHGGFTKSDVFQAELVEAGLLRCVWDKSRVEWVLDRIPEQRENHTLTCFLGDEPVLTIFRHQTGTSFSQFCNATEYAKLYLEFVELVRSKITPTLPLRVSPCGVRADADGLAWMEEFWQTLVTIAPDAILIDEWRFHSTWDEAKGQASFDLFKKEVGRAATFSSQYYAKCCIGSFWINSKSLDDTLFGHLREAMQLMHDDERILSVGFYAGYCDNMNLELFELKVNPDADPPGNEWTLSELGKVFVRKLWEFDPSMLHHDLNMFGYPLWLRDIGNHPLGTCLSRGVPAREIVQLSPTSPNCKPIIE